jgi:hypothetical protein
VLPEAELEPVEPELGVAVIVGVPEVDTVWVRLLLALWLRVLERVVVPELVTETLWLLDVL